MAGLADILLSSMAAQNPNPNTTVPAAASPTDVGAVSVNMPKRTTAPTTGYDNSPEVNAIHNVLGKYPDVSGDPAPGGFGIHGTLRKVLGTLGDAFLVQSGHQPVYRQQMQDEREGQAMVGMANDPAAAAARVAMTGVPNSPEDALKINEYGGNLALKKQIQEQNNQYRQDRINAQNDANLQRARLSSEQVLRGAKPDGSDWQSRLDRIDSSLGRYGIDPSTGQPFNHTSLAIPDTYDANYAQSGGETGNAIGRDQNSTANRATTERGQNMRLQGTQIMAGSRPQPQPNAANLALSIGRKIDNGTASPSETRWFNAQTNRGGLGGGGLAIQPKGGSAAPQFVVGHKYRDAKGNVATYGADGKFH